MRFCGRDFDEDVQVVDCVNEEIDDLEPLRALRSLRVLRVETTNPHEHFDHRLRDLEPLR